MAWVQRANGRRYLYLSKRMPDGRVSSTYLGKGAEAIREANRLFEKKAQRQALHQEKRQMAGIEAETERCTKQLSAVHEACLLAAGFHNPKGRGWRWNREVKKSAYSEARSNGKKACGDVTGDINHELTAFLKGARKTEPSAIAGLQRILSQQKGLFANLLRAACKVQMKWICLIAKDDLFRKEVLIQETKALKGSLLQEGNGSNLEIILTEQIVLLYLQLYQLVLNQIKCTEADFLIAELRQQKNESAAKAYMKSLKTMIVLRKIFKGRYRAHLQAYIIKQE